MVAESVAVPADALFAPRTYVANTWVVHAALGAIRPEDHIGLSPQPRELVVAALAVSATLGQVFGAKELAENSFHPAEYRPLTEDEAQRVLTIGANSGLLRAHDAQVGGQYSVAREELREHLLTLIDWLPDLRYLDPEHQA